MLYFFYTYLTFFIFFATSSHAYIDPGQGGIIIQLIIAFFAGISLYFNKIKNYLIKKLKKKNDKNKL